MLKKSSIYGALNGIIALLFFVNLFVISQAAAENLSVLYPVAGEVIEPGRTYELRWIGNIQSIRLKNGDIIFSEHNGNNSGSFYWTVPFSINPNGSAVLQFKACCGEEQAVVESQPFQIKAAPNLIDSFAVSANTVHNDETILVSWDVNGGLATDLTLNCDDSKASVWNSQAWKSYHCGDTIKSLPLHNRFYAHLQDYQTKKTVTFILGIEDVDYKILPNSPTLSVDFYPPNSVNNAVTQTASLITQNYQISPVANQTPPIQSPQPTPPTQPVQQIQSIKPSKYIFNKELLYGTSNSPAVKELQKLLKQLGFYKENVTGNFYNKTFKAVKDFQRQYNIKSTGRVGPATRAKLNNL